VNSVIQVKSTKPQHADRIQQQRKRRIFIERTSKPLPTRAFLKSRAAIFSTCESFVCITNVHDALICVSFSSPRWSSDVQWAIMSCCK
jgi:hypothetical protein